MESTIPKSSAETGSRWSCRRELYLAIVGTSPERNSNSFQISSTTRFSSSPVLVSLTNACELQNAQYAVPNTWSLGLGARVFVPPRNRLISAPAGFCTFLSLLFTLSRCSENAEFLGVVLYVPTMGVSSSRRRAMLRADYSLALHCGVDRTNGLVKSAYRSILSLFRELGFINEAV